ncbi:MAG: chemotaxis protein CheB, partial [Pseudomonadota bacterium]|nr:chemotaxis protein CheB [Pseudomonadota bacterium]
SQCGAIVFTGMADDGTAGARLIHQNGGQVWVQSPSSCTISSMPDEALNTGVVSVIASPEGLAARLVEFMQNEAGEPL